MRHVHDYVRATSPYADLGLDHWPTDAEYTALHKARDAVLAEGRGASFDCKVLDGSDHFARVEWVEASGAYTSMIISYGSLNTIRHHKLWHGVPEKAPMVTNVNNNTVIVNVPGQGQAPSGGSRHTTIDARQWHDGRQWHTTTHNHGNPQGAEMPSRGPHYINAQPHNDFIDHWPTPEEAEALAAAKREADRLFARGHRGAENTGKVRVRGGNGAVASVWRDAPQSYAAFIQAPNPAAASGWMTIKGWWGVPEYSDYGIREAHPATQGDSMSRHRVPGGEVHINAPGPQVHHIHEDIHLVHQRRFHHHRGPDEHIHHGAPEPARIDIAPTRVSVEHAPAVEHHHEAPRGFWATVFLGPKKRQAALPAPAAEEYRGALQSVPAGAATALPAPQGRREALAAASAPPRAALPAPSHADALSVQVERALAAPSRQALPVPGGWFSTKARR